MLNSLPFQKVRRTYQISGENPTGGKGCANIPFDHQNCDTLSSKLKVHPFITAEPGETITLADISGEGSINEFFFTTDCNVHNGCKYSKLILRCYWDDETVPSVECPIGAFFANAFDENQHQVESLPVVDLPRNAYSAYWTMPFKKRAKLTLTNENESRTGIIAYRVLYQLYPLPEDMMYFHARYRTAVTIETEPVYTILDGVSGKGTYVGTYLAWRAKNPNWWGEGEVKFYIDGDREYPSLSDNGSEDYFGGSFGFSTFNSTNCLNDEHTYSTPFLGVPLFVNDGSGIRKISMYRWHILDSIGFFENIKVTIDTISLQPGQGLVPISDELSSVAYWYQAK